MSTEKDIFTTTDTVDSSSSESMPVYEGDHMTEQLDFYLSGIILLIICILGLLSNTAVVIVLTRKSMKSSTNCFLLALALFDSVVLICTPFMICFKPLSMTYSKLIYPHVVAYVYPLGLTAQTCTIWITVSFTVERYIAVTHPLKASSMCTIKRARITTIAVAISSVIYNLSRWFEYKSRVVTATYNGSVSIVTIPDTDLPAYQVIPTSLEQNPIYEWTYFTGLYLAVMCIIPVVLLSVLNYFLIQAVRKSRRERLNMGNAVTNKENNITTMLVSVVAVFIICQVPALVYNVAYGIAKPHVTNSSSWQTLSIVRNFMVIVNSAINFILYCFFGQKFRKVFLSLFCTKKWVQEISRTSSERRTATTSNGFGGSSAHIPMLDKNSNKKTADEYIHRNGDTQL